MYGPVDISVVRVDLSRDGGVTWTPISKKTRNRGFLNWKVKGPATRQAKIRVCNVSTATGCDTSAPFAIQ